MDAAVFGHGWGICSSLIGWWEELWTVRYRENSRRIDLLARVLFPLFFIVFNIIV